jgi:hypothetical protein
MITIPTVCDDRKCMTQVFLSLPLNQTKLKGMTITDLTNFKSSYITKFKNYLNQTLKSE